MVGRVPRQPVGFGRDPPVGPSHCEGPALRPPHHHPLDEGLTTDGGPPLASSLPSSRGGLAAHLGLRRGARGARTSSRSVPPGLRCPRASACPCRRGGTASRSRPSAPAWSIWFETCSRTSTGPSPVRSRDGSRSSSCFLTF